MKGDRDDVAARGGAWAAFLNAGQSCIAVQRVFIHEWLYDGFLPRLMAAVGELRTGDPFDEAVEVGPLISETAAQRVEEWIDEAAAQRRLGGFEGCGVSLKRLPRDDLAVAKPVGPRALALVSDFTRFDPPEFDSPQPPASVPHTLP